MQRTRRNPLKNPQIGDVFERDGIRRRYQGSEKTELGGAAQEWVFYAELPSELGMTFQDGLYRLGSCTPSEWSEWSSGSVATAGMYRDRVD